MLHNTQVCAFPSFNVVLAGAFTFFLGGECTPLSHPLPPFLFVDITDAHVPDYPIHGSAVASCVAQIDA
jgi:hypothetical protein